MQEPTTSPRLAHEYELHHVILRWILRKEKEREIPSNHIISHGEKISPSPFTFSCLLLSLSEPAETEELVALGIPVPLIIVVILVVIVIVVLVVVEENKGKGRQVVGRSFR